MTARRLFALSRPDLDRDAVDRLWHWLPMEERAAFQAAARVMNGRKP